MRGEVASTQDPRADSELVRQFAGPNAEYYAAAFDRLSARSERLPQLNWSATLLGPLWLAARGLWGLFWMSLLIETLGLLQIVGGANVELDAARTRAQLLSERLAAYAEKLERATTAGEDTTALETIHEYYQVGTERAREAVEAAATLGPTLVAIGIAILLLGRFGLGALANRALHRQFSRWQVAPHLPQGRSHGRLTVGLAVAVFVVGLTAYRIATDAPPDWISAFPLSADFHEEATTRIDSFIESVLWRGRHVLAASIAILNGLVHALQSALVTTPWVVVMLFMVGGAWSFAGGREAIVVAIILAYLSLLGLWERSMVTLAVTAAAGILSVAGGVLLGALSAQSRLSRKVLCPVLEAMRAIPALVYLAPVLALFGTGVAAGVIATSAFALPPVTDSTLRALRGDAGGKAWAIDNDNPAPRERGFGVSTSTVVPTLLAGIRESLKLCLSMVVIASLIGVKGLGEGLLAAIQYGADGKALLAGLGIALCAIGIDRVFRGKGPRGEVR